VTDLRGDLGFPKEALAFGPTVDRPREHLDRDLAARVHVEALVDDPDAAARQDAIQPVATSQPRPYVRKLFLTHVGESNPSAGG